MTTALRRDMREIILDATERLLARYGYQKMTMEDLAREAGIGKRTIYLHFPGKEEVALCSIDRVVERLLAELRTIARKAGPPEMRLMEMLQRRVLFRFDSVQGYYQSFNDMFAALRPAYMARRERYFAQEAEVFTEILEEGRASGAWNVMDACVVAQTLLYATNSLLPYSLSAQELGCRDEVAERVARIARLLMDGLRQR